jgi:hypothetical protein
VIVTDGNGLSTTSNAVTLTVSDAAPVITVQPTNQTVVLGAKATFSVTAIGNAPLTYQWQYLSGATWVNFGAGTGTTTATMTTNPTTAGANGLQFRVVVTDGNGLTATSNPATLSVFPQLTLPTGGALSPGTMGQPYYQFFKASGGSGLAYVFTVNGSQVPPANPGNTSFLTLPGGLNVSANDANGCLNGQTCNLVIQGTPNTAENLTLNVTVTDSANDTASQSYTIDVINPNAGHTVSGTVNYGGSATGWIFLKLVGGSTTDPGTAIPAKGAFAIRGVQPGTYTLQAWMDNLGSGAQNASNPVGATSNLVVTSTDVTGASVTLSNPAPYTLTTSPTWDKSHGAGSFIGGAFVSFDPIKNGNGVESPTSYTLEYSTDSTFGSGVGSKSFPAVGGNNSWFVTGLANTQTYYFRAAGVVGSGGSAVTGPWSAAAPSGGMVIGGPPAGNTVSGTVTFSQAATGPLYVGFYNLSTGSVYTTWVASPVSPQNYSVVVPGGSNYFFFAALDQNNDGAIDPGDITNVFGFNMTTPSVAIGPDTLTQNLTLPAGNSPSGASTATVTTGNGFGSTEWGTGQSYEIDISMKGGAKRVVAVALLSGPDLLAPEPEDFALCPGCGYDPNSPFFLQFKSVVAEPAVGAAYGLQITYSDGTSETVSPQVTAVLPNWPTNLSPAGPVSAVNLTPTLTWSYPPNAGNYFYQMWFADENWSAVWSIPNLYSLSNSFTSSTVSTPSITWGTDPTGVANNPPRVSSLTSGEIYYWEVKAYDADGNWASYMADYVPGFTALALPAANPSSLGSAIVGQPYSGSITASGGYGGYNYSINGTNCFDCGGIPLGNGLTVTNATGTLNIGGTPNATGPVTFTVYLQDVSWNNLVGPVQYTINVLPANTGFPVSGTVSYGGSKTGWVYLALYPTNCGGCNASYGTAISAPGAFTINGVPDGAYKLQGWMDILGYGVPNASDPSTNLFPNVNVRVTSGSLTGVSAALGDPAAVTLSGQPSIGGISPFDGGAFVSINGPLQNSHGVETPTSYTLQWNTSSSFDATGGNMSFPANGGQNPWIVSGIADGGPYYFRVQGVAGSSTSNWSNNSSAVTIGAPTAGNTVSGTVTLPSTIPLTGPLYAGFYDMNTGNIYAAVIASPSNSTPNSYSVQVPTGSDYFFFGIVDQSNAGLMGPGDISNTNQSNLAPIAIDPSVPSSLTQNLTLNGANSQTLVMAQSNKQTNSSGAVNTWGTIDLRVNTLDKLPVAVQLTSGPSYIYAPTDIVAGSFNGNFQEFDYSPTIGSGAPSTSDVFSLTITYSDGAQETPSISPSAVLSAFVTGQSPTWNTTGVNSAPTFTWSYPSNAGNYTYQFQLSDSNGNTIWQIPGRHSSSNGFSSSVTPSITWGVDPTGGGSTPSLIFLDHGATYKWQITATDANGNQAVSQVSFTTVSQPLTLPASGTVNALIDTAFYQPISATGGSGAGYVFTVNGNTVPNSPSTLSLSDSLTATTAANTLIFSGTPTTVASITYNVIVNDSLSNSTGPVAYTVDVVNGASGVNNGNLSGTYVCKFDGFNDNDGSRVTTLLSFVADGNGGLSGGSFDSNSRDDTTAVAGTLTGTYSIGADNNGVATSNWTLTSGGTASGTNQYAIALTNATSPAQQFRMVEIDDLGATPSGKHGTTNCYLAATSAFAASTIGGNGFAFGIQGENGSGTPKASVARFSAGTESPTGGTGGSPGGSITNGYLDGMRADQTSDNGGAFTGSYTAPSPATGRFTLAITPTGGGSATFAAYIIDANRMFLLETAGDSGLQAGDMRTQLNTSTYSTAGLTGAFVTYEQRYEYSNGAVSGYDSTVMQSSSNGAGGFTVNQMNQDENGTYKVGQADGSTSTVTFDTSNPGRATIEVSGSTDTMIAVYFNTGSAFQIDLNGSEGYLATGWTEPQTQTTFTNAAVAGNYMLGQMPPMQASQKGNVGEFDLDNAGNITGGVTTAGQGYFSWDQSVSMGYSWDTTATGTGSLLFGSGNKGLSCVVISATRAACTLNGDSSPAVMILQQ